MWSGRELSYNSGSVQKVGEEMAGRQRYVEGRAVDEPTGCRLLLLLHAPPQRLPAQRTCRPVKRSARGKRKVEWQASDKSL